MKIIEKEDLRKLIPIIYFDICLLDNKTRAEICKLYKLSEVTTHKSCFYLEKFEHHVKTRFNLSLTEYCKKFLKEAWPQCPISGKEVGYKIDGKGLNLSIYATTVNKEHSENFRKSCEKMSEDRKGSGNPMYGQTPWNSGLDISHPTIAKMAEARRGTKTSEETKEKQRKVRAESPIKARHTTPHSEETKERLRKTTASLWSRGVFNRETSIHRKMREFLLTLDLKENFAEEHQVKYFSLDFAFISAKIGIECQGTFFHIDPRIYPDGPICAIQRRNFGRDRAKKKFLCDINQWTLIEIWETEINDGTFKNIVECRLKELSMLNNSDDEIR